jgi:hypothetical protein
MGRPQQAPGTILTPDGFRRLPGTRVQYDRRSTIFYKSPRARYWRGANLRPDRRENVGGFGTLQYKFWFRSPRGPAAQNGFHIVEADLNNPVGGGGGGGGSPPTGPGNCELPYDAEWGYTTDYPFFDRSGIATNISGAPASFIGPISYEISAYGYPSAFFTGRFVSGFYFYLRHAGGLFQLARPQYNDAPAADSLRPNTITFVPIPLFDSQPDDCEDPNWTPPGGGGGGGGARYTCTCPDYTKTEQPYLTPAWRSQGQARSWANSRAGSDGYCKHIYSAAFALGDQAVIADIPAGLLPPGQVPEFFRWLQWNEQLVRRQRAAERAFARESLGAARRAGAAARDRYYRGIVEGTIAAQAVSPGTLGLAGFGNAGEASGLAFDPYAYNSLSAIGRDRNFNRIPVGSRPAPTEWTPPELTAEDYPAYMYGRDLPLRARAARLRSEVQSEAVSELGAPLVAMARDARSYLYIHRFRPTFYRQGAWGRY